MCIFLLVRYFRCVFGSGVVVGFGEVLVMMKGLEIVVIGGMFGLRIGN